MTILMLGAHKTCVADTFEANSACLQSMLCVLRHLDHTILSLFTHFHFHLLVTYPLRLLSLCVDLTCP